MKIGELLKLFNDYFIYKSGKLYWKVSPSYKIRVGNKAGSLSSSGHIQVRLKGKIYLVSRVIFLMHYGYLPKVVDHIDGDSLNDYPNNLRSATHSQNSFNSKKPHNNTSGVKGVYWNKANSKWLARINRQGKLAYSKQFDSIEEAEKAIIKKRKELHGNFARHT